MFASVFRVTSARLFRPRSVQPLFARGFADAVRFSSRGSFDSLVAHNFEFVAGRCTRR
jgi:hypothetical protein